MVGDQLGLGAPSLERKYPRMNGEQGSFLSREDNIGLGEFSARSPAVVHPEKCVIAILIESGIFAGRAIAQAQDGLRPTQRLAQFLDRVQALRAPFDELSPEGPLHRLRYEPLQRTSDRRPPCG